MTNVLTFARQALSDALSEKGLRVLPEVPETYQPPVCWVVGRSPYRSPGQSMGTKDVGLEIICVAAVGTNAKSQAAVDEMATTVADYVVEMDGVYLDSEEEISAPQLYPSGMPGQDFLGASVNVTVTVARAEQ